MAATSEERDEILQLLYRYNHAIDSRDPEGWADTFIDDGVFEPLGRVTVGREALVAWASTVVGKRHLVLNPVVEVCGDGATVRAYLVVFAGREVFMMGTYADELVRTGAGWRFAKRRFTADPGFGPGGA